MNVIRILARVRPAVRGNVALGAAAAVAGVIQADLTLMICGILWIVAATATLVLTHLVDRNTAEMIVVGTISDPRQPQLPDVRAHAAHITDLAKVT